MFNDYEVFKMMKFRQKETEFNSKDAWKHYDHLIDQNDPNKNTILPNISVNQCCPYTCAK